MLKLEDTYNPDCEYELWAIGYDKDSMIVPMEEQIGETATDEEEFLEMCAEAKSMTVDMLREMFAEQIKKYNITSIQIQIEELTEDDGEILGEPVYENQFDL